MTAHKLHITFCTDGIYPHEVGGIQRHSRLLIEAIARLDVVKLSVIHPHIEKKVFDNPNIEEYDLNLHFDSKLYAVNCAKYSKSVYAILQKLKPDIVYAQGLAVYSGIQHMGYKTIVNPHGLEPYNGLTLRDKFTTWPLRIYLNRVFKHAAFIVSLGGELSDIIHSKAGIAKKKIVVLPNAVNLIPKTEKKFNTEKKSFLFVGRFAHNKGIDLLLRSIEKINAKGYENKCVFNLVGKGPLYEKMKHRYSLSNVIFHGFANDEMLEHQYSSNDVFVFPTLFEGMPTVVLEAMVHGMPIIVSNTGATIELVDSTNGHLIKKNNEDQLVQSIISILETDENKLRKMSEASYEKVKNNFTWDIVAQKHLAIFSQLASHNKQVENKK